MAEHRPLDEVWPKEKREAFRHEVFEGMGGWYSPWVHLAIPSVVGLSAMGAALWLISGLRAWEVLFGVVLFVAANAAEWRIHKSLLHKRVKFATLLYDRHTPQHHMVFVTDDMSIRSWKEFRLVLLPAYAVAGLAVGLSPIAALIWLNGQHNLACIFVLVTMGYVVSYEWLHLSYHLPADSLVGRLPLVKFLRRHHALHHDPRNMQKWNFNVSLPLWDVVRRTYVRTPEAKAVVESA